MDRGRAGDTGKLLCTPLPGCGVLPVLGKSASPMQEEFAAMFLNGVGEGKDASADLFSAAQYPR